MSDIEETIARNGNHDVGAATGDAATAATLDSETTTIATAFDPTASTRDVDAAFLAELSVAMRAVVSRERDRIAALVHDDAAAHVVLAHERSSSEAEAFRQVAEEDVAAIDTWAGREIERIRTEASRRTEERRADLQTYLTQHEAVLAAEIASIDATVGAYEAELHGFLDGLEATTDPAEIARRAHDLPRPPDLETVRAMARTDALTRLAEASAAGDARIGGAAPTFTVAAPRMSGESSGGAGAIRPSGEGSDTTQADAATADAPIEVTTIDAGLAAMIATVSAGSGGSAGSVAVMDREATDGSTGSPETSAEGDDAGSFGHTNAAVRLIRSVAPWTAPTHSHEDPGSDEG